MIGTAGHVDHGKSTLIQALTGRDPDRWKEEKDRGLTIDLGFAWTELAPGVEVSFVDVPGHVRFMKNMLAGIEAIDIALLVVAADEGWMPQTEEHVAVLDLLGVGRGVVALTKIDRVDTETLELARLEVAEKLEGTGLERFPMVEVSARTGVGMDSLIALLAAETAQLPDPPRGRPRLWVDRSFSVDGVGTVVTGTLLGGEVAIDDRLTLFPSETQVRVRGIQSHEKTAPVALPRRRVAINLGSVERASIPRGAMLASPGDFVTTARFLARFELPRYVDELSDRGAYHLHIGSGAWPVRVRVLDRRVVLCEVPDPLPLAVGDRFILRESGRRLVMAGGRVLDPAPGRKPEWAGLEEVDLDRPDQIAAALLAIRGRYRAQRLQAESGGGETDAPIFDGVVYHRSFLDRLGKRAVDELSVYQRANPLRAGMPTAQLSATLDSPMPAILAATDLLVVDGAEVRLAGTEVDRSPADRQRWSVARERLETAGMAAPRADDLGLGRELLHALIRQGELVKISADLVYLPVQVERILEVLSTFSEPFTVSDFKDRIGVSRKYAVPILEWADGAGHTVRSGDLRRFRKIG